MENNLFNYHYSIDLDTLVGDKSTEFINSIFTDKFYVNLLDIYTIYNKINDPSKLKFNHDIKLFGEFIQLLADTNLEGFNQFIKYLYTYDYVGAFNIISKFKDKVNLNYFDTLLIEFLTSLSSKSIFDSNLLSLTSTDYSIWGGSIFNIFQLNKIAKFNNKNILFKFSFSLFKRILILKNTQ